MLALALLCTADALAQARLPRVGIIANAKQDPMFAVAERILAQRGWIKGKTVELEYRVTGGDPALISQAVDDFVRVPVDVLYCWSAPALAVAHSATRSISVVAMDLTTDPVAAGYAQSHSHPGGNITGVFLDAPEFAPKWLEYLKAVTPGLSRVAVLWDPSPGAAHLLAVQSSAGPLGLQTQVFEVRQPDDIEKAVASARARAQGLIALPSPMIYVNSRRIAQLTLRHRLAAIMLWQEFARAGGSMSYGPDQSSMVERSAALVASVLSGAKPADLPLERPSRFEFIVNLNTIRALGLSVPDAVLLRADHVIR